MKNNNEKFELVLRKTVSWMNPLNVEINNKNYELDNIRFYNKDGVISSTGHGWFNNNSNFDVVLSTSKPIKKKNKIDFSQNIPFIVKADSYTVSRYDLFLPISDFDITTEFQKIDNFIFACYKMYDKYERALTWKTYQASLEEQKRDIERNIADIGEQLKNISFSPISQHEFNELVDRLENLYVKLQQEEQKIHNYTVDDYLKSN